MLGVAITAWCYHRGDTSNSCYLGGVIEIMQFCVRCSVHWLLVVAHRWFDGVDNGALTFATRLGLVRLAKVGTANRIRPKRPKQIGIVVVLWTRAAPRVSRRVNMRRCGHGETTEDTSETNFG